MNSEIFKQTLSQNGIDLTQEQIDQFQKYMDLLLEWNEKMNLTAITTPSEIWEKHFLDSVLPFKDVSMETFCDVGSGAGFPCIPLKIVYPSLQCTIIEPLHKRCRFLEHVIEELGLQKIQVLCVRCEDHAKQHREEFDVVSARAVANLKILMELCTPLCKVQGKLIFLKGKNAYEELEQAKEALRILDVKYDHSEEIQVEDATHINLYFTKEKKTSKKYPRPYGQIKKKPLGGNYV